MAKLMTPSSMPNLLILAQHLGLVLQQRQLVLSLAESCTGGMVAQVVTSVAGSSAWFDRGFVTYSNVAKTEMLGVMPEIINTHGAVSEASAEAMARGALQHSQAHVAGAITGIAGPAGGSPEKPVGMVCFAIAYREAKNTLALHNLHTSTQYFQTDSRALHGQDNNTSRQTIRMLATAYLLQQLMTLQSI